MGWHRNLSAPERPSAWHPRDVQMERRRAVATATLTERETFMDVITFESRLMKACVGLLALSGTMKKLHHAFPGHKEPLSVTPEEARMLFTITRALRPKRILELGTGTGFSTAALAAGWPNAKVVTIDDFSEGGIREKGPQVCNELWKRLNLTNIELIAEDVGKVDLAKLSSELVFIDGWIKAGVPSSVKEGAKVILEHDEKRAAPHFKYKVQLNTQCFLSFHSDDEALVQWAGRFLSTFEPAEIFDPTVQVSDEVKDGANDEVKEDGPSSPDRDPVRRRPGRKQTD